MQTIDTDMIMGAARRIGTPSPDEAAVREYAADTAAWMEAHGHQRRPAALPYIIAKIVQGGSRRGLVLSGPTGTGKTYAMTLLARFVDAMYRRADECWEPLMGRRLAVVSASDLAMQTMQAYEAKDWQAVSRLCRKGEPLVIDDLGAEPARLMFYGSEVQPLADVLTARLGTAPTYITTNLSQEEIERRYTPRVLSRILGSCAWVTMDGEDLRCR